MKVILEVVAGPHTGARFEFDRHDTFVVGRDPAAHLRLSDDPHFSRHHFLLEFDPPRCFLRDLGSRNGTLVNNQKVDQTYVNNGDIISGGNTRMRLSVTDTLSSSDDSSWQDLEVQRAAAPAPGTPAPRTQEPPPEPMYEPLSPVPGALFAPTDHGGAVGVPGYTYIKKLGQGGMGEVYLAEQQGSGREVAIKLILPESASSDRAMQMFLREISVLSRLDHPRIVRFLEMGTANGQFFFVMEYVPTIDVRVLLSKKSDAIRMRTMVGIICQALQGLAHAHANGFVHRDIKPSNILISREGKKRLETKVADFGLAKNFESSGFSGMTHAGQTRGTVAFMAPEQILNARDAKPAADLYAVGATLYHYLAGRPPHVFPPGREPLLVILEDPPTPLDQVLPNLPAGFSAAVMKALQKRPEHRYANADEMRRALKPFALG